MKKEYTYCILSLSIIILSIAFTISAFLLQTLPHPSKSALLLLSICFMLVGICAYAVHYKKYIKIKLLFEHKAPILAHWTYNIANYPQLKENLYNQKSDTISTAILGLILSLIFSIVFAYSGSSYILYTGYILAVLSVLGFILALRFITSYYQAELSSTADAIFGEEYIYFLGELYTLQKSIYFLENIKVTNTPEPLLQLIYGQYDIDDIPIYVISIPIPPEKQNVAKHLREYYLQLISYEP